MPIFLTSNLCECEEKLANLVNPKDYKLAVISNASDMYDNPVWVKDDLRSLERLGFEFENIDLRKTEDVKKFTDNSKFNSIFVAGGNTFYLLKILKKSGVFAYLQATIKNLLYLGSSAGSVICAPNVDIIKYLDKPLESTEYNLDGLDFVDFQILPHFGNEYFKPKYELLFQDPYFYNTINITLRDSDALWIQENKIEMLI